ncbi:unnamed protein product [Blepharisma stoltei]|uniref:3CxxC-type domain-containing protein n=1 Tax=Blepharisma stoltei TaxID=1481888 RepID=A0AAU9II99_9CILI|nr:unnamed protein product [Blepharisma stoltei]
MGRGQFYSQRLTPYQGQKRCYGFFECDNCERYWESAYSWANMGQQCRSCLSNVYPWSQKSLEVIGVFRCGERSHEKELCEMCSFLGYSCVDYDLESNSDYDEPDYSEEDSEDSDYCYYY